MQASKPQFFRMILSRSLVMLVIAVLAASCATFSSQRTINVGIKSLVGEQGSPQAVDLVWVYDDMTAKRIAGVADRWFLDKGQIIADASPKSIYIHSHEIVPQQILNIEWDVRGWPGSFFLFVYPGNGPAEIFVRRYDGKAARFDKIEITLRDDSVDVAVE